MSLHCTHKYSFPVNFFFWCPSDKMFAGLCCDAELILHIVQKLELDFKQQTNTH